MISAVILTKNEEENIADCIVSLSFCDEIIVIDDDSRDQTVEIAKKYKIKAFQRPINGDFSAQRNFGLEKARGKWVLFVDADERVSKTLGEEIQNTISGQTQFTGFYIVRRDILWGRELGYGEAGNARLVRLGEKDAGEWVGKVHERWIIKSQIGLLKNKLWHYPHLTVGEFVKDVDTYTTIRAKELFKKGIKAQFWHIILYPIAKFVQNYFLKQGFRDEIPGLLSVLMMSFHSFLVRAKLWHLWHKK